VCGASKGIAYASAEEFARAGCSLAICSRDATAIANAGARLQALGVPVLTIVADLSTSEGLAHVVQETTARYGHVDILITNTGGPPTGPAMEHDWAAWTRASELLLRSVVELTRAFVPGMRERKWGSRGGYHVTRGERTHLGARAEQQPACGGHRISAHVGQ
jgi:3-oxoacyl-[acyl-carrier protein] reductase